MATTTVYLILERARAAEAAAKAAANSPAKAVHLSVLGTGPFGRGRVNEAISALSAAGGSFHWRHVHDGLLASTYYGLDIAGPGELVDALLSAAAKVEA